MLIAAWPAHAAIAVVQSISCSGPGTTTCTTAGITTTTGNLVVAGAGWCCGAADFTSFSDSKSNSWTNAVPTQDQAPTEGRADYSVLTSGGGSHTFTVTANSGADPALGIVEISGQSASPLDQIKGATDGGGTSHTTGNTPTTTQANEALVGFGTGTDSPTFTTDSGAGWTERANIALVSGYLGFIMGTKIVSSTGAYAYTYTSDVVTRDSMGIMTFKEAASTARQRCIGCETDKKVIGN